MKLPAPARAKAAASLAWGLGFFACLMLGLEVTLEVSPIVRDPEFGLRLQRIRTQKVGRSDRPLVVVLGSSRVSMGFKPDVLADSPMSDHRAPLVFNYSLVGSGPIMQLLCLDRLIKEGIRPDLVFVEFWPPFYRQDIRDGEEGRIDVNRLNHRDVRLLGRFWTKRSALVLSWIQSQLVPVWSHRFILLSHYAPDWLPWTTRQDVKWMGLDDFGWLPLPETVTRAQYETRAAQAREYFAHQLNADCLNAKSDRALRELVTRCRRENIEVALLYMPEGSLFRGWYAPPFLEQVNGYLDCLHRELELPVVDARSWIADDDFIDGFHLLPRGARAFTRRFGRDAIRPLLERRASHALQAEK
jgi:hypothetical protein